VVAVVVHPVEEVFQRLFGGYLDALDDVHLLVAVHDCQAGIPAPGAGVHCIIGAGSLKRFFHVRMVRATRICGKGVFPDGNPQVAGGLCPVVVVKWQESPVRLGHELDVLHHHLAFQPADVLGLQLVLAPVGVVVHPYLLGEVAGKAQAPGPVECGILVSVRVGFVFLSQLRPFRSPGNRNHGLCDIRQVDYSGKHLVNYGGIPKQGIVQLRNPLGVSAVVAGYNADCGARVRGKVGFAPFKGGGLRGVAVVVDPHLQAIQHEGKPFVAAARGLAYNFDPGRL